jgi:signal transduction histidine kinase
MPSNTHHLRAELVGLGDAEAHVIRDAGIAIAPRFSAIVDRFYEQMLAHEPLRAIIAKHTTTTRLKDTFKNYLIKLFSGSYSHDYDSERVKVGQTHDRVNLPLMWYLGMFSLLEKIIFEELSIHYTERPLKDWLQVQKSITSIIKYDQLLAVDAYVNASYARLQEQTDAAEKARKAKSIFLATVSHELRTPLSSILGYSDLILDTAGELSEQTRHYIQIVRRNADSLLTMINGLIEIGRVDSGKAASDVRLGSINQLLDDIAADAEGLVNGKPIKIEHLYATTPDVQLQLDFAKMRQILTNIVGNACKYTDTGKVTIDKKASDKHLSISVTDTGPGIAEEHRDKIFHEFFRVKGNKKPGSGLGLSLVKTLLESMHGSIEVESNHPQGTRFTLTWETASQSPPQSLPENLP